MKTPKDSLPLLLAIGTLSWTPNANATIELFDYLINVDGALEPPGPLPGATFDDSLFDYGSGLGTIDFEIDDTGPKFVGLFLDHEIDQAINTFFNEFGTPVNTPELSQSWEIDEPGFLFGDIYDNFLASDNVIGSQLDNSNGVPSGAPDDVAMALGWDIDLGADQKAAIQFVASDTAPRGGFYLQHTDPDSDVSIYFSSSARIIDDGPSVPDTASTLPLFLTGLLGLGYIARQRRVARL